MLVFLIIVGVVFLFYKVATNNGSNTIKNENYSKPKEIKKCIQTFEVVGKGIFYDCLKTDCNRQELINNLQKFDPVTFERDLNNEFDKNAVFILDYDGFDIGYVNKEETKRIIYFLEESEDYIEATIKKTYKTSDGKTGFVVEVEVLKTITS